MSAATGLSDQSAMRPTRTESQTCEPHFADDAWHGTAEGIENVRLARDTHRLRIHCPAIARRIVPGQFVMLRLAGCDDPLLGRPLALYDTVLSAAGEPVGLDLVYLVVGKLTRRLAELGPGAAFDIWGPLGNGFDLRPTKHLIMVAGGIGQTPFPALAQEYLGLRAYGDPPRGRVSPRRERVSKILAHIDAPRVTLCYGTRSADYLAGVEDFQRLGVEVHVSTDDGTAGHHGLVTEVLEELLNRTEETGNAECGMRNVESVSFKDSEQSHSAFPIPHSALHIACCGPEPMMEAVARLAQQYRVSCQVSLETPMACGIGICFSCVAKVRQDQNTWDYRRTCVEGPVFDAQRIVW